MGAQYQPTWNGKCTHCVSAFEDTPKYNQAEAAGGINVRTDWVEDCYTKKRKLSEKKCDFQTSGADYV